MLIAWKNMDRFSRLFSLVIAVSIFLLLVSLFFPDTYEQKNRVDSIMIVGFAVLVLFVIYVKRHPIRAVKDSYHPTNFSAHSDYRHNNFLK